MKNINPFNITQEHPDILLVEDNDDDAEMVTSIFEKNHVGNSILRLKDGKQVIDYFLNIHSGHSLNSVPKIILLDYKLPGIDGISLLKRLRLNEHTRNVPVMLFTGFEGDTTAFESYRLGITSIITKNATYEALEKSLMEVQLYLNHFKVLIVDDSPIDAQMVQDALYSSKIQFTAQTARNEREYIQALEIFKPDVIFCDYDLKKYDAIRAVRTLHALNMNVPFIMVTGQLTEDFACGCLSEGIKDYLLKSNLTRLPSSLVNALRKKKIEDENTIMQEELEKANKELQTLFNNIDEVLFSMDMVNYKLIQVSSACEKMYGYTRKKFFHDYNLWRKAIHPDDICQLKDDLSKLQQGETIITENRFIRSDGQVRWQQRKVIPTLDENGKLIRVDGVASDITGRKTAEEKLNEKIKELNTLIYRLTHDIRGPVCSIGGLTHLALMEVQQTSMHNYLEKIKESNEKLDHIILSMTDLLKIDSKARENEKIDFKQLISDILGSVAHLPGIHEVAVSADIKLAADFYSQKASLYSLLYNLIHNAIVYRKQGPGAYVRISVEEKQNHILIRVLDNGSGIPAELQQDIFEMFFRGNEKSKGAGLGLYIVKNLTEKLNGKICLESEPGKGTCFSISLPYERNN